MEILFLGTCAADYDTRLDGELRFSNDKELKRCSSALLDDRFLIDCGPHTVDALNLFEKDISKIDNLFITHLHSDHFNIENVKTVAKESKNGLTVWVREDAIFPKIPNVKVNKLKLFKKTEVEGGLSVTGLIANHDKSVYPQWFLFENQGKKLLYALDGAWFINDTYEYLKEKFIDIAVMDATVGDYVGDYRLAEHNSIPMLRLMKESMLTYGIIKEESKIILSHMARTLHKPYAQTVKAVKEDGFTVAYDGLIISV